MGKYTKAIDIIEREIDFNDKQKSDRRDYSKGPFVIGIDLSHVNDNHAELQISKIYKEVLNLKQEKD